MGAEESGPACGPPGRNPAPLGRKAEMNRRPPRPSWARVAATGATALLLAGCGRVEQPLNSFDSQGPIAERINDLFWPVFWMAVVIFVLVQGALLVAVFLFRERKNDRRPNPKQPLGNPRLELAWTIIPTLILAGIAVPTVATLFDLAECPDGAMEVEVIGHQWWFEFRYPEEGITTANVMVIPEDTEVCAKMTSDDVLHNFWVPKLAGKRYLVPGQETEQRLYAEQPGEYWGHCAEFCGLSHARMRARVSALTAADYDRWVADQAPPAAEPEAGSRAAEGKQVFLDGLCVTCHIIRGVNEPDPATLTVAAPDLTHFASRNVFAGATLPDGLAPSQADWEEGLRLWLADPPTWKPGSFMPNLGLTADEVDALVAYMATLR